MIAPRDIVSPMQRVAWRDGQTLASSDLADERRFRDRFRALHLRYQHRTWGVVEGLYVSAIGTFAVAVAPGYAIDAQGAELLLPLFVEVAIPNDVVASTTMYLTISRAEAFASCSPGPGISTLCVGASTPAPIEAGALSWKTAAEVRSGRDVLLARGLVASGKLASALDGSVRRGAATMALPAMWSDETLSGQTGWSDAVLVGNAEIRAQVDTSNAGFVTTPVYFARVVGASLATTGFLLSTSAASFTYALRDAATLLPNLGGASKFDAAAAEGAGWTISWFAVEPKASN